MSIVRTLDSYATNQIVKEDLTDEYTFPGRICYQLHNVLKAEEVRALFHALTEEKGFNTGLNTYPPSYRDNDRLDFTDEDLADKLFKRVLSHLPAELRWPNNGVTALVKDCAQEDLISWHPVGLNPYFRCSRYKARQFFGPHLDGAFWLTPEHQSKLSWMLYLNEDFEGGATNFFTNSGCNEICLSVRPKPGTVIIFEHDLWHEGAPVHKGTKIVMRSDVIYKCALPTPSLNEEIVDTISDTIPSGPPDYKRPFGTPRVLSSHENYVWSLARLDDVTFATGSRDKTIRIWNIRTGQCHAVLKGHRRSILALCKMSTDDVITFASGARDSCLKIWVGPSEGHSDWRCLTSVEAHPGGNVLSLMETRERVLWSGSSDTLIKGWRLTPENTLDCIATLKGHTGWVWSLCELDGGLVGSASEDMTIRIWDPIRELCVSVLRPSESPVLSLRQLSDSRLISGSMDGVIRFWRRTCSNVDDKEEAKSAWECTESIEGHSKHVRCLMELPGGYLASGSEDMTVKIWRMKDDSIERDCLATLTHRNYVREIGTTEDGTALVSVGYDAAVRVWTFANAT